LVFVMLCIVGALWGLYDWYEEQQIIRRWILVGKLEGLDLEVHEHLPLSEQLRGIQLYAQVAEGNRRVYKKYTKQIRKQGYDLEGIRALTKEQLEDVERSNSL
jgi:hypothetical protein